MPRQLKTRSIRPVYLFCCEDSKSSRLYLNALKQEFGINIQTVTSGNKTPKELRRRLKQEKATYKKGEIKQAYCLFDQDELSIDLFKTEITETEKLLIKAAVSAPCYEYWLLLHLKKTNSYFKNSHECSEELKAQINQGNGSSLSLEDLKKHNDIFTLVGGKEGIRKAISNAKSFNFALGDYPYTNMHEIIEELLSENNITL